MLRNLILAFCATAFILSGCGRQVTPNRAGTDGVGLQPGFMQVKFTTAAPLDFTDYQYIIAFNTSSTPGMPYAQNGNQSRNWQNFSFEIVVGGAGGFATVQAYEFVTQSGGTYKFPYPLHPTPQILQPVNTNCNGQGTQFCITFNRSLFNGISVPPRGGATPQPSPTPQSNLWFVNWFSAAASGGTPVDAPGLAGVADTSFVFGPLDVNTGFDRQWTAQAGWPQVAPPAQIVGGEVINNP